MVVGNDKYVKYQLLDFLDDVSSAQKMIDVHDINPNKINNFMVSQYRDIRRKGINGFNIISNGKKIR
jgi:membrane protease subunit (stomatin/prohibitin family)